jgi:short-subunit dehydrogenase
MNKLGPNFKERYGPWGVICGASDGTGRAFTHRVAATGINCVIIARRGGVLEELAQEIRSKYELRPHNVDVLYIALVATDTPFLQNLLEEKGQKPMRRASSPDDVAQKGLANSAMVQSSTCCG